MTMGHILAQDFGMGRAPAGLSTRASTEISTDAPTQRSRRGISRLWRRKSGSSTQTNTTRNEGAGSNGQSRLNQASPVRTPPVAPETPTALEDPVGDVVSWINEQHDTTSSTLESANPSHGAVPTPPQHVDTNAEHEASRTSSASNTTSEHNEDTHVQDESPHQSTAEQRSSDASSTEQTQGHDSGPIFDKSDGEDDTDVQNKSPRQSTTDRRASDASSTEQTQGHDSGPIFDESDIEDENDLFEINIDRTPSEPPSAQQSINRRVSFAAQLVTEISPPPEPEPMPSASAPRGALGKLKQLKQTIKGWHAHAKDEAYVHGFGISSTSLSATPFRTDTRTARAKPFTGVVREGDAAIEPHQRLTNLPGGTPPAVLHESPIVQALEASNALDRMFLDESILPGTNRRALFDSIKQIAAQKKLEPFEAASLTQALHIAFAPPPNRQRDAAYDPAYDAAHDASIALKSLPQTNLLDSLRDTAEPPGEPHYDADKAWALAQEIVHIPGGVGMSLLEKLTPQTPRPEGTHASVIEKDRILVTVLLKASQQAVREARASGEPKKDGKALGMFSRPSRQVDNAASPSPGGPRMLAHDPASIFADGALHAAIAEAGEDNWPGRNNTPVPSHLTLAQKAMLAVKEELSEIDAHVERDATRGTAFSKGTHGSRFAISMIRGDMLTDATHEPNGVRSQFGLTESRLGKSVGKHLDRAMRRPTTWARFMGTIEAMGRHVGVYKNKSPFYTYNRIAENDDGRGMGVGNRSGTHAGRAFRDMIDTVHSTIDDMANLPQEAASGDDQALRLLVRSSIMQTTKDEIGPLPRYAQPGTLSELSQEKVVKAVMDKLGRTSDDPLHAKAMAMTAEENHPLTAQRLMQWGAAVGGPANEEALEATLTEPSADRSWHLFADAFKRAENPGDIAPIETPSLRGKSREEVADILAKIVAAEELGSGFAFDSAGNVQGTTKNISGLISRAAMHFIGSVHVDLGGGQVRTVRFESVTSTDRSQLRVSVMTLKRGQGGVGGTVGHFTGHDHPVTLGGGIDVGGAYEVVHQEGAVLGFPRNLSGGVMGDRAVNEKKAQLVKMLVLGGQLEGHTPPANEEDRKSLIKCAYQAFGDDLSIGFYEMDQTDKQGTLGVNASVGMRFDRFKLSGPTLGVTGKSQGTTIRYRDQSGFLKTEWETDSTNYNASFQASLAGLNGYDEIQTDPGDPGASVMTSVAPFLSGSAQFFRFGVADRRVQIMQDGKELPTSFSTRTFQAPISFLQEFGQNVDKYAEEKAKQYFAKEYNAGGQARENVVAREKAQLIKFVDHYLKQKDLTSTPQLYTEFGGNVDTANKLRAAAYMADRAGNKDTANAARQEIDAIHTDQKYREGRFLTSLQVEQEGRQVGVNGIVGLTYARNDARAQQVLTFT
ncbi:hypothetical protein [Trinickia acidisoli]|uniref:hypothetical protein n=1 Tax=Trinickia acidisoli TaxID=2767482 RepID=UPI001A8C271F|nr:hypothetical protein [Trinickia acidisoli]